MKIPLVFLLLGMTAALVRGDIVIVQNVNSMMQNGQMTAMIGTEKVRTDVTPDISTLVDLATGDVTTITHSQKSYMVMTASMTKAMAAMALQQAGSLSTNPAAPVATGKKDKINGYDASEYTFTNGNIKATYWVCTDYPDGKAIIDALAKMEKSPLAQLTKGFTPAAGSLPGVPVRTEVDINGQKMTTDLVSAKEQAVDAGEYQIPAGYTEVRMPAMPGMPQAAPQPAAQP